MKVNKSVNKDKASKKAAKKALEQNLTDKLFEVVKSLGHDAEKIGEELVMVSKFMAKKISKKFKAPIPLTKDVKEADAAAQAVIIPDHEVVAPVQKAKKASPRTVAVHPKPGNSEEKLNKTVNPAVRKRKPASATKKEQPN